jgi:hypothetical protein
MSIISKLQYKLPKFFYRAFSFLCKPAKTQGKPSLLGRRSLIYLLSLGSVVSALGGCGNRSATTPISQSPDSATNYSNLAKLLETQQWKAADRETVNILLALARKSNYKCDYIDSGGQGIDCIRLYPCKDLKEIDQLWLKHSQGRFGFSVLANIWREVGSPSVHGPGYRVESEQWERFAKRVGWYKGEWMSYDALNPSPSSPEVIFPFLPFEASTWINGVIVPQPNLFHYRLADCGL